MAFDFQASRLRSELYRKTRQFFDSRDYLEVDTPVLSPDLIPESTIDCFATTFINGFAGSRELYMVPSPEIFMKRLIAAGSGSVYQISKCFRNCEQLGSHHNPEFTMLEYYTVGADENDSLQITQDYLYHVGLERRPVIKMTVREAVLRYSGLDLDALQKPSLFREAAGDVLKLGIPGTESWADTFNRIFCTFVETSIPHDSVVYLTGYPAQIECLAQKNGNYRRRWEVYIDGIETANCYLEETDEQSIRDYYRTETAKLTGERQVNGRPIPDSDPGFAACFSTFPECSGVALGMDRLLMVLCGYGKIRDTLLFPFDT